jgi:hypothetical protein
VSLLASITCAACAEKTQEFQTSVQIARTQVVTTARGKWVDVELEYSDCPGEQREIFQADATFYDCLTKYRVGESVAATVVWSHLPDGHYDSEIDRVGECKRKRDALDERSYEVVHECHDIVVNGVSVGFRCDRKPSPELLAKCPWFRRT